mgnify:CR=1 FL=1
MIFVQSPDCSRTTTVEPFSALAITALVFAIIAALLSWVPIVNNIAFFIAIIGLVFAGFAMHVTRKAGPRRGKALAVAALVVLLVAGGLVLGTQTLYGKAIDTMIGSSETTTTSKPKKSKAKTEKKAAPAVQDMEGDVDGANYHVKLDSLTKTVNDYEGKPTVMLTYEMTNNKSENSNPMDLNGEPPRPYCRGFRAFRRDDCFRHGYMTSYEVTPRFRGLLHAHVVLPVGRLAWPGDI